MFVDEDYVDSRSDVARTRDCIYGESRQVRYVGCCSLTALYSNDTIRYDTIEEFNLDSKAEYTA